jgi:hypothetical protein
MCGLRTSLQRVWPLAINGSDTDVLTSYTFRHLCRQEVRTSYIHLRKKGTFTVPVIRQLSHNCEKQLLASSCVRPSVRMSAWNNSAPIGRIFMKFWYVCAFRKYVEKIQVSLKSDKNSGHFTCGPINIFRSYLAHFFLEWKKFQTKVVEKLETRIFLCNTYFFS